MPKSVLRQFAVAESPSPLPNARKEMEKDFLNFLMIQRDIARFLPQKGGRTSEILKCPVGAGRLSMLVWACPQLPIFSVCTVTLL